MWSWIDTAPHLCYDGTLFVQDGGQSGSRKGILFGCEEMETSSKQAFKDGKKRMVKCVRYSRRVLFFF